MINIRDKQNCCGCGACAAACPKQCISMQPDEEGFLYPSVAPDLCIDCDLCNRVCTMIQREPQAREEVQIYAAYTKDRQDISRSSSGGVFSELAKWTLLKGGVIYGAAYGENMLVQHMKAETWEECVRFRGSKYVQSRTDHVFAEIKKDLAEQKHVLFTGTPCQVSALRKYLRKDSSRLLTCDVICHAVTSPALFRKYITYIENSHGGLKISGINMKDKVHGWQHPVLSINFQDGTVLKDTEDCRLWMDLFYSHLPIRPSCHNCPFCNTNRPGDISIGDYWGIGKSHPEFENTEGTSLVFVNTSKGNNTFEGIKPHLSWISSSLGSAMQPSLISPVKVRRRRKKFFKDARRLSIRELHDKYLGTSRFSLLYAACARLASRLRTILKK